MNRTSEQWAAVCPKTVAKTASPAAVMYLIGDALSDIARLHRQADQLRAEVEALQKDADRYRRLRDLPEDQVGAPGVPCVAVPRGPFSGSYVSGAELDAAMATKEVNP